MNAKQSRAVLTESRAFSVVPSDIIRLIDPTACTVVPIGPKKGNVDGAGKLEAVNKTVFRTNNFVLGIFVSTQYKHKPFIIIC